MPSESALDRFFSWRWLPVMAWVVVSVLFLFLNRGAYRSYFDGADLIRLEQFSHHSVRDYLSAMFSPVPGTGLDGPLGRLTFGLLGQLWRGTVVPYIALLHGMHLVNLALLIVLALQLKLVGRTAALAAGVFGIHSGAIEAFWGPGHLVELECAFFVLISLLAWVRDLPVVSAVAYWLAVQCDLTAIFLPLAIALYAWWVRPHDVKWLGLHGVVMVYGLLQLTLGSQWQWAPAVIWLNLNYYLDEVLVFSHDYPRTRYLVLAMGLLFSRKLHRFAFGLFLCTLLPLLCRVGSLGEWSIYVPILGIAMFLGLTSDLLSEGAVGIMAVFSVCLWVVFQIPSYLEATRGYQVKSGQARSYVETFATYNQWPANGRAVLVDDAPELLGVDGVRAALHLEGMTIPIESVTSNKGRELMAEPSFMLFDWASHKSLLMVRKDEARPAETKLYFDTGFAALDLGPGWFNRQDGMRWTKPQASFRLRHPDWGDQFVISVELPKAQIQALRSVRLRITAAGKEQWSTVFEKPVSVTVTWKALAEPATGGTEEYQLFVEPAWTMPETSLQVGLHVRSIGYQSSKWAK